MTDCGPLAVLLDITPSATPPETRTGLARVAWELARGLCERNDVAVRTCAWGSLQASQYFAGHSDEFSALSPLESRLPPLAGPLLDVAMRAKSPVARTIARRSLQVLNRIRNPLTGWRPEGTDVVHGTYSRIPAAVRRSGVPFVLTLHDVIPLRLEPGAVDEGQQAMARRLVRSIRRDDWVACVSDFTRQDFLALTGHRPDRAVTVVNGVDHATFRPPPPGESREILARYGLADRTYVLTLSSLAPHKNLPMLFRKWPEVRAACPQAVFVVAGGKHTNVEQLRRTFAIPDHAGIVATGHVTDTEFCALAARAAAFLFPSRYEGFGLPALEAMAAGAPVIAANATSLPEVVGDAGTLIDPADAGAWRDAIIRAVGHGPPSRPNADSLRRAASFSWQRTAAGYVQLYRRIKDSSGLP